MRKKGLFMADNLRLVPSDDRAMEIMEGLEEGNPKVLVWVHKARYPEHHRLAWAVFQRIADATGQTAENILLWLKLQTGRFDYVQLLDGSVREHPHSIAFESMAQDEFQQFWNDALVVI